MSKLSVERDQCTITLHVEGTLENRAVNDLETSWEFVRHDHPELILIDVCKLNEIDEQGRALLLRMLSSGVQVVIPPYLPHTIPNEELVEH